MSRASLRRWQTRRLSTARWVVAVLLAQTALTACSLADFGPKQRVVVTIAPASVTLAPSAQQGFAATVTGPTNTSVTWSSTGGVITGAGSAVTFTAPADPGTYEVRATSAADPSKQATAQVVVTHPSGSTVWTRQFGSSTFDEAAALATDATGNVVVAGSTEGDLDRPSLGPPDAFVRKYGAAGNLLWADQFGTSAHDGVGGVAVDPDGNVIVVGSTLAALVGTNAGADDVFVRKYGAAGNTVWTRQFGTSADDWPGAVAVGEDGSAVVVGSTGGALGGQNSGSVDAFVRKYDPGGNPVWTRQFGTPVQDYAVGVAIDRAGNVFVVGSTNGVLGGSPALSSSDAFVTKYGAAGDHLWTRQFGSGGLDGAEAVAVDAAGNAFVVGQAGGEFGGPASGNEQDAFVRKYDPDGDILWTRSFGTAARDEADGIAVDGAGDVLVVGFTSGDLDAPSAGDKDAFARKYGPDGSLFWARQLGTDSDDLAIAAGVDRDGYVFLAGVTDGDLAGANGGESDAFVTKLAP